MRCSTSAGPAGLLVPESLNIDLLLEEEEADNVHGIETGDREPNLSAIEPSGQRHKSKAQESVHAAGAQVECKRMRPLLVDEGLVLDPRSVDCT